MLAAVHLLYTLLVYALTGPLLLFLGLRPAWRLRLRERLGFLPPHIAPGAVWVHAASVGEVQAARPLIEAVLARVPVLVTTNTPTGAERVRALFGARVQHAFAPLDLPGVLDRFLAQVQPRSAVVLETELWPNRFRRLRRRGIPLVIVNARLSPRSFPAYRRFGALVGATLADCTHIAAQSEADAQRFRSLGAAPARVSVMGNLKYDLTPPADQIESGRQLRAGLGDQRPVWIAASTREGEEALVLDAHLRLLARQPDAALILVPRHPPRFEEVARLLAGSGLRWSRRTQGSAPPDVQVLLGDTLGELFAYYAAADVAFVGGSLVPLGGQNVLEPAALGRPVLFGPHTENFAEPCQLLEAAGGAQRVQDPAALAARLESLLLRPEARALMGAAAAATVAANRGALSRVLDVLQRSGAL